MKKIKSGIFILFFSVLFFSTTCFASIDLVIPKKSEEFKKWENLSEEKRNTTIFPSYSDIDFKDSVKRSTYNSLVYAKANSNLESSYNLKNSLPNITVKDQMRTNACWAFSISSVLETTLAKKYGREIADLSAIHMEYMTTKIFNRNLGDGGNPPIGLAYLNVGYGPIADTDMPFNNVYDPIHNKLENTYLADVDTVDLNKLPVARVTDSTHFPSIYKKFSGNTVSYMNNSGQYYTMDQVNAIRTLIKQHIKSYGAVTSNVHADFTLGIDGSYASPFYNSYTAAYNTNDSLQSINHQIVIVGWDDNYSIDNFVESARPKTPGAYIALNSYSSDFGKDGYYYISYEDLFIEQYIMGINSLTTLSNGKLDYDKLYQYDPLGESIFLSSSSPQLYACNTFKRDTSKVEYLSQIGIYISSAVKVEVYVNTQNGDKSNLTLVASPGIYNTGYHTISLPAPLKLTGSDFVVAIKYSNNEGINLPLECNLLDSGIINVSSYFDTAKSNVGESFISSDGTTWKDLYDYRVSNSVIKNTNACIKAFSILEKEPENPNIAITSINVNKNKMDLEIGNTETLVATILPNNATNQNVSWISSNPNIATVNNGVVTAIAEGSTTITVTTEDGNKTDSCSVIVTKKQISVSSISLNFNNLSLKSGETKTLLANVLPSNATNQKIIWSSSHPSIATVNNGIVSAIAEGSTTITATTEDGNKTVSCSVLVTKGSTSEIVNVTSITLNFSNSTLKVGETKPLIATVLPNNATNQKIIWSSSHPSIATVNNGIISAIAEGTTLITVTTEDNHKSASCFITVEKEEEHIISVTDVSFNTNNVALTIGNTYTLKVSIAPNNATNQNISWNSSDNSIATIKNNVITAVAEGSATITVVTEDGNKTASCIVNVNKKVIIPVDTITLNQKNLTMQVGEDTNLIASFEPTTATNKEVSWTSSNTNIATISENGIITAIAEGSTIITVTTKDGSKTASCELTVLKKTISDDDIYQGGNKIENNSNNIAPTPIPQTGEKLIFISIFIVFTILLILIYTKYKSFKDIK